MKFTSAALFLAILSPGATAGPVDSAENDIVSSKEGRKYQEKDDRNVQGRMLGNAGGKKSGMGGKKGGLNGDGDGCNGKKGGGRDVDCTNPVEMPLYQQSYTFDADVVFPLDDTARVVSYYSPFGWCGNNAGDNWCIYDEGGEGALGNNRRSTEEQLNSAFAFVSETAQNAAGFAHTNPDIAGTFSTDDVTTLSWKQANGNPSTSRARDAMRVGLLIQEMEGQPLSWYVSETTYWHPAGANENWMTFEIDLTMANFYVIPTGNTMPTYPELPLSGKTPQMLPAGATIISLGWVWPNSGNIPNPTTKASTGRWDDVLLSGLVCPL